MSAEQGKIEDLAYRLWQDAGSPHGQDVDFWLAAEATVKAAKPVKAKAAAKPKVVAEGVKPKAAADVKPKAKTPAKAKAKV